MRWVKPVDDALIEELARTHDAFVTVEEHAIMGGAGSACLEAMAARDGDKADALARAHIHEALRARLKLMQRG